MGFLDKLFHDKTRRAISHAVNSAVDNVINTVKDGIKDNFSTETAETAPNINVSIHGSTPVKRGREDETGDNAHCEGDENTVRRRIEKIAAEDWPGYELRQNIPAAEFGAGPKTRSFDYGLYLDGQPKVMIMILKQYQHRNDCVNRAHNACEKSGVGSFHLLMHMPNRRTYIAERIKASMPS